MLKPRRYLSVNVDRANKQVLALFPSINFHDNDVGEQRKEGMKTSLRILCIAADEGYVHRYMLSRKYEFGGDSITRALKRLERLELLRAMPPKLTSKRVKRIDYVITGKGLIACMSLPRFQQVSQLNHLLLKFRDRAVARVLILLNRIPEPRDDTETSAALHNVMRLSDRGINIEHKSEDDIYRDLLAVEEIRLAERFDPILDGFKGIILSLTPEDGRLLIKNLTEIIEFAQAEPEAFKSTMDIMREFLFLLESPELQAWLRLRPSPEDMIRVLETAKRVILSEIVVGKDYVATRESLIALFGRNENAKARRSKIIRELRELFAFEVTRKVDRVINSPGKKE